MKGKAPQCPPGIWGQVPQFTDIQGPPLGFVFAETQGNPPGGFISSPHGLLCLIQCKCCASGYTVLIGELYKAGLASLETVLIRFFFPNSLNPQLIESTDVEPTDMESDVNIAALQPEV